MRCRKCEQSLWNLTSRVCPECGTPFAPSEYEFLINSVRYCCPHCDQAYYGTDAKGHLEPREFPCVECGRTVNMDEMVLRPAVELGGRDAMLDSMPWFERDGTGAPKRWFRTLGAVMTRPGRAVRGVPRDTQLVHAWMFMFVTNLIFRLFGNTIPSLLMLIALSVGLSQIPSLATGMGALGGGMLWQVALMEGVMIVSYGVLVPIWALMAHGLLRMTGPIEGDLRETWYSICYGSGANALSVIPCGDCMKFAGAIWWTVSSTIMVKESQRVSGGRATFAVLVSGFIITAVIVGVSVGTLFASGIYGTNFGTSTMSDTMSMSNALRAYVAQHGEAPPHALALVASGDAFPDDFDDSGSFTTTADMKLADKTMVDVTTMTPERLERFVDEVAGTLPADVVAHRVGDFVFTYHGADLTQPNGLWTVVMIPDPDAGNAVAPFDTIYAASSDGVVNSFPRADLARQLTVQNAIRAANGLPPLPDLQQVRHGAPARSGAGSGGGG